MFKDSIKLTGKVSIKKYNENKELVKTVDVPNLVVTIGKEFIAARMIDSTPLPDPMAYMAIGDDESTVTASDSSLINEVQRETASPVRTGVNITFNASFGAGVAADIKEAGIFNSSSSGTITFDGDSDVEDSFNRINYASHPFEDDDKVTYTDGGGTTVDGLSDGNTYYVVNSAANTFQLSETLGGSAILITGGSGAAHKLTRGVMLCRTTFPLISKSAGESLAITWVVTVG
jgi:hypothetical protein